MSVTFGDRRYRVRGLAKNTQLRGDARSIVLATHGRRRPCRYVRPLRRQGAASSIAQAAAAELEVEEAMVQRDLGRLLLKLEELQDADIQAAMKPKAPSAAEIAQGRRGRGAGAVARSAADRAHPGGLRPHRARGRARQHAGGLSRRHLAQTGDTAGHHRAVDQRGRQDALDGRGAAPRAGRGAGALLRDDGPEPVLLGEKDLKHKILAIAEEEGVRQAAMRSSCSRARAS